MKSNLDRKKTLSVVGENWEFSGSRRTLTNVTDVHLEKVRIGVLVARLLSTSSSSSSGNGSSSNTKASSSTTSGVGSGGVFPAVKMLRISNNEIKSFLEVRFIDAFMD